jgi:DNA repair exonuclease SbcCD nuclease subunit
MQKNIQTEKTMKLLYLTDTQIRGINSENRIGDYYSDVMIKIKEIIFLSKGLKVNYVIHGGDLFDSNLVSNVISDYLIDSIEESKIIWYIVRGNHDELNNHPELSKASSLDHIFRRSKFIKHLDILEDEKIIIKGYDYYYGIENNIKENGLICPIKNKKFRIAIIHAFFTEKPFLPSVLHIPIQEIETNFDLILSGHNHIYFHKIIDETEFYNLGCIGRLDINEGDVEPSVLFIDTNEKVYRVIKLKSAKKKEEIFDLKKIEVNKIFEEDINKFIASIETTTFESLDLCGIIEEIGKQKEIDREIIRGLTERINNHKGE